jgi:hypothetical protein
MTMFARRIFDLLVPAPGAAGAPTSATAASAGPSGVEGLDAQSKAGLFFSERTGEPLRLGVDNGRLRIQGGPPLDAVTRDRFRNPRATLSFMSNDEFELRFLAPDEFELKSMEGKTTRYRRAQPYAPNPTDLKDFEGRYENDEIGAVFRLAPAKDGLLIRLNDSPDKALEFKPVDRDTFQFSRVTVRFRRDKAGKVVALDYSNPALRHIEFTRLSDRQR